jgi:hypothetical protein
LRSLGLALSCLMLALPLALLLPPPLPSHLMKSRRQMSACKRILLERWLLQLVVQWGSGV